ncbi:Mu transposase C-terminal domain-containing protein [Lysobacter enzymogenes]|uniref:Mu transposase C-terminal domain-containing protein n=1 Tax=Lysobacter enzymogenes TaxID=69 RepID=UPI00089B9B9C|nr:Mu transposase C-terminal domain-containing protein [Lysobacter enzymogenes]SDX70799.1 putative transposase [Lysobacter enzymogenes]
MGFDPLEFLAAFLPGDYRVLTRTGVEINNLQYWSDALSPWVGQRKKVLVTYDPRDITFVYVRTPGGVLVRCSVTTLGVPAISLAEWQSRRRYEDSLGKDPERVARRHASMRRNDERVAELKASRRVRRRRATEAAGDRFRSVSTPTAERSLPVDTAVHIVTEPELEPVGDITSIRIYEIDTYE